MPMQVVELKPDWPKGYSRVGAAAFGVRDYDEAVSAYEKGTYHVREAHSCMDIGTLGAWCSVGACRQT
jgi:hypothetical protein